MMFLKIDQTKRTRSEKGSERVNERAGRQTVGGGREKKNTRQEQHITNENKALTLTDTSIRDRIQQEESTEEHTKNSILTQKF